VVPIIPTGLAGVSANHTSTPWAKSRSLLGTITGIERSRVQDLQNPDPDKALAPHWRVPGIILQYDFGDFVLGPKINTY